MSSFVLSDEQTDLASDARALADRFAPGYLARAKTDEFFWDEYQELGRAGYLGLSTPKERGGLGASAVDSGIVMEQIGRGDFNIGFALFNALCTVNLVATLATASVREQWLARQLSGEAIIGLALTEPGAGSDARGITTRAQRTASGWRIDGEKVSSGFAAHAGAQVIFCRTGDGHRDIAPFLVPLDLPGVASERINAAGYYATGRSNITLSGVQIPEENLIGELGSGMELLRTTFEYTRGVLGLLCYGTARTALELAIDFVSTRETFGRPLISNQGVTFDIAEHSSYLESVRWLSYHALGLRDAGADHAAESSMVKWLAPKYGVAAINAAMVLMGQRGYSEDLPIQQMLRDVSGLQIGDGTPHIQKMIIAKSIFGRDRFRR